jgi:hypothetical protein
MTPRLLSREQAAAYCGVSRNHFNEHIATCIKCTPISGRKLWDIKLLNEYIDRLSGIAANTESEMSDDDWLAGLRHARGLHSY